MVYIYKFVRNNLEVWSKNPTDVNLKQFNRIYEGRKDVMGEDISSC